MRLFLILIIALYISGGGNAEVITRSQFIPYAMGGSQITFSLIGIISEEIAQLKCVVRFHDGRDSIVLDPSVPRDGLSAICRLPPEIHSGRVYIDLQLTTTLTKTVLVYEEAVVINPSPITEVQVEENWDTRELSFTWDHKYFEQFYNPGANISIQATLYVSDSMVPVFKTSGIVQIVGLNSGTSTVPVSQSLMNRISDIHYPYFYVLNTAGWQSDIYLPSVLFAPVVGMNVSLAVRTCGLWMEIAGVPTSEEIHSCPPCLCQVELDSNFIPTEYDPRIVQLANGDLDDYVLYYERVPTNGGHAQTCSYNTLTGNLASTSPPYAGWIQKVSKFKSYVDMVTFESVKYNFMGWGEFWLIRGPEGSEFGVQGRMSSNFEGQKASFFKAVAIRDGNTTVQIQLKEENFKIFLIGIEFRLSTLPIISHLYSVSLTIGKNTIDVRLQSGFTIIVENVEKTYINVFGTGAHSNKRKGFMGIFGNFDDNDQNDLTSHDGFVIPPTSENLRNLTQIHHRFGLTWMITAKESFFVYEDGKSWEDYADIDFGPILEYPDPATLPNEVVEICGDSLFCYYEYVGTGSLDEAAEVARWEREFDNLRDEIETVIPMCDLIPSPAHGRVQVNGHLNGALESYSCDNEYDFDSGDRIRFCYASNETSYWTGEEPACIWTCTICSQNMDYQLSHDPSDCTKFFLCSYRNWFSLECPSSERTFSRELLLCTNDSYCPDEPGC